MQINAKNKSRHQSPEFMCRSSMIVPLLLLIGSTSNLVLASKGAIPIKLYVYDLPQWRNFTAHGDVRGSDYGLDQARRAWVEPCVHASRALTLSHAWRPARLL